MYKHMITNQVFIKKYLKETETIIKKMPFKDIDAIIDILFHAWLKEATVFVMGNGGSASTASHFAADLAKYTIPGDGLRKKDKKRFKVLCLTDNMVTISAWTNDNGFHTIFTEQMEPWIKEDDVVVAFSVHGGSMRPGGGKWSENIPEALKLAKKRGAKIVGFAGDSGGIMKKLADACIVVPTVNHGTITPHVEGLHVVLHHLVIHRLKQLIEEWEK